jgi:NDP-hexose C3-ketoreductase / dTDP-4-oxo-2-deoxy-alpha-D-pentos-2-ene 2,3-reductase
VEPHRAAIERYEQLCADLGQEPTTRRDRLAALDHPTTQDVSGALEKIFPPIGNGGPAPEAWAW